MKKEIKICPKCKKTNFKLLAYQTPELKFPPTVIYQPEVFECNNCGYMGVFPSLVKNKSKKRKIKKTFSLPHTKVCGLLVFWMLKILTPH